MAKRPSDLDAAGVATALWVLESDAPDGGATIVETEKLTIQQVYDLGAPSTPGWTSLTLINGWTGEAFSRVVEGYLEIFINASPETASSGTLATLTAGATPDYFYQKLSQYGAGDPSRVSVSSSGNVSLTNIVGEVVTVQENFKFIRLIP